MKDSIAALEMALVSHDKVRQVRKKAPVARLIDEVRLPGARCSRCQAQDMIRAGTTCHVPVLGDHNPIPPAIPYLLGGRLQLHCTCTLRWLRYRMRA